jgi:hypothetical protein
LVLVGNRFWFYLLCTYVLRVQYSCGVGLVFWFLREYVFAVMFVLSVHYVGLCHFCCCDEKVNFVRIFLLNPNFLLVHRKFSSRTYASFSCFGMDLKPYSRDCFSKILSIILSLISKQYLLGSLFKRNNLLIFRTGVSCFSRTLFYSTFLALTHGRVTCH